LGGTGAGGTTGVGGAPATGGTGGVGGRTGTGGSAATGGITGAGGRTNTGGATTADASADAPAPKMGTPCRSQSDCGPSSTLLYCLAPGESVGCGMCRTGQSECASDSDCASDGGATGGRKICDVAPSWYCYCRSTVMLCIVGCRSNADCPSGQGCNASHACQQACTSGDDSCGADYACSTAGFCERKTCTGDAQCSVACVNGKCYGSLGACQAPVA
jgi:hypothetical protein